MVGILCGTEMGVDPGKLKLNGNDCGAGCFASVCLCAVSVSVYGSLRWFV